MDILKRGGNQLDIVRMIRSRGTQHDAARQESFAIFAEARTRVRKAYRWRRLIAWAVTLAGMSLPFLFYWYQAPPWISLIGLTVFSFGIGMLREIPDPKPLRERLPE